MTNAREYLDLPISENLDDEQSLAMLEYPKKESDSPIVLNKKKKLFCGFNASDLKAIMLLLFLYLLQGIPLGMAGSIPFMLQSRSADYKLQGTFSLSFWPFSLKLLWAPIVDAIFWARIGRRKSWLVPIQYLIGIAMLLISMNIYDWLGDVEPVTNQSISLYNITSNENTIQSPTSNVSIVKMTASFFILNFLAASQDVVVDGWALTLLSRNNVGWASICNTIGQIVGFNISYICLLALESADFCNNWIRSEPQPNGIITFSGFLIFWGVIFMVSTTLVAFFKSEKGESIRIKRFVESEPAVLLSAPYGTEEEINKEPPSKDSSVNSHKNDEELDDSQEDTELGLSNTYRVLLEILRLRPIQEYIIIVFVVTFGFSAGVTITNLKLIDKGVPKERLAFLTVCLIPIQTLLPLVISRWSTGPRPLTLNMKAAIPSLFISALCALVVFATPYSKGDDGSYPILYFIGLYVFFAVNQLFGSTLFVTRIAFHNKISDPKIGSTYMTLLNTVSNLASMFPSTLLLYLVDPMSSKSCLEDSLIETRSNITSCVAKVDLKACTAAKGKCVTFVDGYYIEIGICFVIGLIAIISTYRKAKQLDSLSFEVWSLKELKKCFC